MEHKMRNFLVATRRGREMARAVSFGMYHFLLVVVIIVVGWFFCVHSAKVYACIRVVSISISGIFHVHPHESSFSNLDLSFHENAFS